MLRKYTTLCTPLACVAEKQLQLSQRSLLGMGRTKYDTQDSQHTICKGAPLAIYHHSSSNPFPPHIDQDNSEQVVRVLASKSFAAVQTASGKVYLHTYILLLEGG